LSAAGSPGRRDRSLVALGRALREIRRERGLTQEELAQRVNLHETYISRIENGQRNPTWGVVLGIMCELGVPLAELPARLEKLAPTGVTVERARGWGRG